MSLVKDVQELGSNIGEGVEVIGKKVSDAFDNLASHLPFSNFAKKQDSSFHLEVDLPGVKKEEIDIQIDGDVLIVSAVRKHKNELNKEDYYICESSFGKIERRYVLPENIDQEKVEASFSDGRLEIELQKTPKAKSREITIK